MTQKQLVHLIHLMPMQLQMLMRSVPYLQVL